MKAISIAIILAILPMGIKTAVAGNGSGITTGLQNPYGGTTGGTYGGGYSPSDMAMAAIVIIVSMAVALQVKKSAPEPQGNDQVAAKPPVIRQ